MRGGIFIVITMFLLLGAVACTEQTKVQIQNGEPLIVKKTAEQPAQPSAEDTELQSIENELADLDKNEDNSLEEDLDTI